MPFMSYKNPGFICACVCMCVCVCVCVCVCMCNSELIYQQCLSCNKPSPVYIATCIYLLTIKVEFFVEYGTQNTWNCLFN